MNNQYARKIAWLLLVVVVVLLYMAGFWSAVWSLFKSLLLLIIAPFFLFGDLIEKNSAVLNWVVGLGFGLMAIGLVLQNQHFKKITGKEYPKLVKWITRIATVVVAFSGISLLLSKLF